jgi:hypothetical protein
MNSVNIGVSEQPPVKAIESVSLFCSSTKLEACALPFPTAIALIAIGNLQYSVKGKMRGIPGKWQRYRATSRVRSG